MEAETKQLVFKFEGEDVNITSFGHDFIKLTSNVYALVQACSDEEVRMVSIENNCIKFVVLAAGMACSALFGEIGADVKNTANYNAAVRGINALLEKHASTLELEDAANGSVRCFSRESGLPTVPEARSEIKTTLAVYGELLDVGGANPNVHIRSDAFENDVVLDVGKDDAQKLAQRLYCQIGVHASVTVRDGSVSSGKVLDIIDYTPKSMEELFSSNVPGIEAFRNVDVAAFIAEQRG